MLLWGFSILERERYGSIAFRKVLQKEIISLSDELVDQSIVAIDILAPSSFVIGSPFADLEGEGFKEYFNLVYTAKDTFGRVPYFE
jgi:hypothetical protein